MKVHEIDRASRCEGVVRSLVVTDEQEKRRRERQSPRASQRGVRCITATSSMRSQKQFRELEGTTVII